MRGSQILTACVVLLALIVGSSVRAEDSPLARVGRVAIAEGSVAVRAAGAEWADSGPNDPVAAGMSVRTAAQGRAVLHIGAETIALFAATEIDLAQLDASGTQIVLRRGQIGVHLSQLDPARSIEIDIARGGVWLLTPGEYEITAGDERAPSRIAVMDGRARFVGKGLDAAVATGSATELSGSDPVSATLHGPAADDSVAWWRPTTGRDADPQALRHVSAEMTGHEALDGHGIWQTIDGYGAVWFPQTLPDGWAPFRHGRWRWVAPWGWNWIDDMAWGFAPSHYGRWARLAGPDKDTERWGWVPGKLVANPAYMPASVAFLGTAGVGLSCPNGIGPAVAWFPLAPGEAYWPSFTHDLDAIRRLNADSVADLSTIGPAVNDGPPADIVNGDYRNRRFASVVPRAVFLGGRPVAPALVDLPEGRLENAPVLAGSPQLAPRATLMAAAAAAMDRRIAPKLATAVQALSRILKPRGTTNSVRAAVLVRSASTPARLSRALVRSPARSRVVGKATARTASLNVAAPRRHP